MIEQLLMDQRGSRSSGHLRPNPATTLSPLLDRRLGDSDSARLVMPVTHQRVRHLTHVVIELTRATFLAER